MSEQQTKEQRVKTANGGHKLTDEAYNERWMKHVLSKVRQDENGCWIWQGFKNWKGYGQVGYRGKNIAVHRQIFMVTYGVKLGFHDYVCHACDVKPCCNPLHLFRGDNKINQLDAANKGVHGCNKKTHCPRGHKYDDENTYVIKKANGRTARDCRICQRARMRIDAGWPEHLAYSMGPTPKGYRPMNGSFKRKGASCQTT